MKLNKDSWHYKLWCDTFDVYEPVPTSTDLCRYCHRIFWRGFLYIVMAIMVIAAFFVVGYAFIYKCLIQNTFITLTICGVLLGIVGIIVLYIMWLKRDRGYRKPKTLVGKWVQARKQQVCPLVEFVDSDKKED